MIQVKKGALIRTPLAKLVVTRIMVELMVGREVEGMPPQTKIKLRCYESEDPEIPLGATVNISARGLQTRFQEAQWKLG